MPQTYNTLCALIVDIEDSSFYCEITIYALWFHGKIHHLAPCQIYTPGNVKTFEGCFRALLKSPEKLRLTYTFQCFIFTQFSRMFHLPSNHISISDNFPKISIINKLCPIMTWNKRLIAAIFLFRGQHFPLAVQYSFTAQHLILFNVATFISH